MNSFSQTLQTVSGRFVCRRHFNGSLGFTLVELMAVIALVSLLAAMAAPSFSSLIATQRIRAVADDINASLWVARSEALKRNMSVTISPKVAGGWGGGGGTKEPSDATGKLGDHIAINNSTIVGPSSLTYRSSGRVNSAVAPHFDITAVGTDVHWCVMIDISGRPFQKASSC